MYLVHIVIYWLFLVVSVASRLLVLVLLPVILHHVKFVGFLRRQML